MQLERVINCAWDGSLARSDVVPRLFLIEGRIDVSRLPCPLGCLPMKLPPIACLCLRLTGADFGGRRHASDATRG